MPFPSFPKTSIMLLVFFMVFTSFPNPAPITFHPIRFESAKNPGISDTSHIFNHSTAPELTLATAGLKGAEFFFGIITPSILKK